MKTLLSLFVLIACLSDVHCDPQLTQSEPVVKKPGESHTLTCKASGFQLSSHWMAWVRQLPDGKLHWLCDINGDGATTRYEASVKDRVTISRDNSNNVLRLKIDNMKAEDTAVYYCARYAWDLFDIWGNGCPVTVSAVSQMTPLLFPLIPCGTSTDLDVTIGCLAKNFFPSSIEFSWADKSNNSFSTEYKTYGSVLQSGGTYVASSQVAVSTNSWNNFDTYFCKAKHLEITKSVPVQKQQSDASPIMTMHPPIKADLDRYGNGTVVCHLNGFSPSQIKVTWLKDNKTTTLDVITEKAVSNGNGRYMTSSYLTITKEEWDRDTVCSCSVKHDATNFSEIRILSKSTACEFPSGPSAITVFAIPPSFETLYMERKAPLTCLVSNMNNKDGLEVSWYNNNQAIKTEMYDAIFNDNGTYSIKAVATVCPEDWNEGKVFECVVKHPDLATPYKVKLVKPNGKTSVPTVLLFPPHQDELARKEGATITCMAKDHYPADIFFRWLDSNNKELTNFITSGPIKESSFNEREKYLTYSILFLPSTEDWTNGEKYTCMVGHESLPLQATQRTIDKTSARVFYIEEDDDIDNLWTTASTFIVLFLLSLFYSATVTLFKVK